MAKTVIFNDNFRYLLQSFMQLVYSVTKAHKGLFLYALVLYRLPSSTHPVDKSMQYAYNSPDFTYTSM